MAIDTLMGMHISDDESYTKYRESMLPILTEYGGSFRYDFRIEDTLISSTTHPVNRVFVIRFPNAEQREAFFSNEAYADVKRQFFDSAVESYTEIGRWSEE